MDTELVCGMERSPLNDKAVESIDRLVCWNDQLIIVTSGRRLSTTGGMIDGNASLCYSAPSIR